MLTRKLFTAMLAAITTSVGAVVPAIALDEFYKGKTINVIVGFGPGGANDVWTRVLNRYMPRHIPGQPTMVAQNMPGAGSLRLANHIAATAPKDGTEIGLISRGIALQPLFGSQNARFDPRKMTWIGSPNQDTIVAVSHKDSKVQKLDDLHTTELVVGASGLGADSANYPLFLADLLGMKLKMVTGYPGTNEVVLAIERKEVQGTFIAFGSVERQQMYVDGKLNILFQTGLQKDPSIPAHAPLVTDFTNDKADLEALRLFLANSALGRPYVAPPELPAGRGDLLRKAFMATMQDPDFLAETQKLKLSVSAMSGEDLERIISSIYKAPKPVVQRVTEALGRFSESPKR